MDNLKISVTLVPHQEVYTSGQDVIGNVVVSAISTTACRAIFVKIKGYARVEWNTDDDDDPVRSDEEVYVENTVTVWAGSNFGDNLMAGEFCFPFEFKLPPNIPSSYEGKYGHIRYLIEAKAEVPWGTSPLSTCSFRVDGKYDLNHDPGASTIKFKAQHHSKKKKQVLNKVRRPGFRAGNTDEWISFPIRIPVEAVCLQYCNIISAKYSIEITSSFGFCSLASVKEIIKVGSLPVGEVIKDNTLVSCGAPLPSAPPTENFGYEMQPILHQPESSSPFIKQE
ncbi:arrestin domain-containing protein 3-like isoform X3 [Panulirus ornatus]|uniref:arrestin domain-containing protein 3-like isoform X3 n=1 Tax=Panulirus ornatus TaxID=150431 RepID=UPI003A8A653A